jgi:hypothetical protein
MQRYIFLDFDGVICTQQHRQTLLEKHQPLKDDLGPYFDPEAVANLRAIIDATDASIVVTSSWKYKGLSTLQTLWTCRNMPGTLLDVTPIVMSGFMFNRGMEINQWLYTNTQSDPDICRYVILDDALDFLPEQRPYLINTNPDCGLTAQDAAQAIAILTT